MDTEPRLHHDSYGVVDGHCLSLDVVADMLLEAKEQAWNEGREYEAGQAIQGWNGSADANPYRVEQP